MSGEVIQPRITEGQKLIIGEQVFSEKPFLPDTPENIQEVLEQVRAENIAEAAAPKKKRSGKREKDDTKICLTAVFDVKPYFGPCNDPKTKDEYDKKRRDVYKNIREELQRWRYICNHSLSILYVAENYGMELVQVEKFKQKKEEPKPAEDGAKQKKQVKKIQYLIYKPNWEDRAALMKAMFPTASGKESSSDLQGLYKYAQGFYPHWQSYLYCELVRVVDRNWRKKIPDRGGTLGYWAIQGIDPVRVPVLRNEPLPILRSEKVKNYAFWDPQEMYTLTLNWNKKLGPLQFRPVGIKKGKLDKARMGIWKALASGHFSCGTIDLTTTKKGRIRLYIPYYRTKACCEKGAKPLDPAKILEVAVSGNKDDFFTAKILEGHESVVDLQRSKNLGVAAAFDYLIHQDEYAASVEQRLAHCGTRFNRNDSGLQKAYRKYLGKQKRLSEARIRTIHNWNNLWTKHIIKTAVDWGCGKIIIYDLPKPVPKRKKKEQADAPIDPTVRGLLGKSWSWDDFKRQLEYKANDNGIAIVHTQSEAALALEKSLKDRGVIEDEEYEDVMEEDFDEMMAEDTEEDTQATS